MGGPLVTFTDYAPACGAEIRTFFQLLADTLVTYDGHCYINAVYSTDDCDDIESCLDCNDSGKDPLELLAANAFALDECGHLALKIFLNQGAGQ